MSAANLLSFDGLLAEADRVFGQSADILASPNEELANPKVLINMGFGQFDRFGQSEQDIHSNGNVNQKNFGAGNFRDGASCEGPKVLFGLDKLDKLAKAAEMLPKSLASRNFELAKTGQNLNSEYSPERASGAPRRLLTGAARLRAEEPAPSWPAGKWIEMQHDLEVFERGWLNTAKTLGWTEPELYRLALRASWHRYDVMGLVPSLRGRPVIAMTETSAAIRCLSGNIVTHYRRVL